MTLVLQGFGVWGDGPRTEHILNAWLTVALMILAVGIIAARAVLVRRERWIWMTLAVALGCYAAARARRRNYSVSSERRPRNRRTALVCSWLTRLSVTPRTSPISRSVKPS